MVQASIQIANRWETEHVRICTPLLFTDVMATSKTEL